LENNHVMAWEHNRRYVLARCGSWLPPDAAGGES
jgi:hypothetical protein